MPDPVITGAATDVGRSSATLNGTVNPEGVSATAYFEYGLTTDYALSTAVQNVGSGLVPVAVEADIAGLQPGREYHFRVVRDSDATPPTLVEATWT